MYKENTINAKSFVENFYIICYLYFVTIWKEKWDYLYFWDV